ncbi:MAG: exodeoxyribonuclease VII small subunit [Clostridia bacterium]|nr:exodeoxyribonuclease VII small subunit [Clostridia bacterium]
MEKKSFDVLMKELEELVGELEGGETGLEKALELYKKGVGIIEVLNKKLETAKKEIEIAGRKPEGEPSDG